MKLKCIKRDLSCDCCCECVVESTDLGYIGTYTVQSRAWSILNYLYKCSRPALAYSFNLIEVVSVTLFCGIWKISSRR